MPETVNCPECGKKLRVPDNLLGRTVSCPGCGKKFTAEAESEPPGAVQKGPSSRRAEEEPEERPARRRPREDHEDEDDRPRRRRPRDEDDEDEDDRPRRRRPRDEDEDEDEEDRPRRRRARDEDEDEDDRPRRRRRRSSASAAAATKPPGVALLVVGILGLLAGGLNAVLALMGTPLGAPQAQPGQAEMNPAVPWIVAVVWLIWGAVVSLGGVKLMQLQSRGSIMVACIFAMLPCNVCFLAGLPIGIWALVVLARPDVKAAFS